MRITVLVPAHNERLVIGLALESLAGSRPVRPTGCIVVADNCTDDTADDRALAWRRRSSSSVDNTEKKAGALNQALAGLLPGRRGAATCSW